MLERYQLRTILIERKLNIKRKHTELNEHSQYVDVPILAVLHLL